MMDCRSTEFGRPLVLLICGTLVYYHCAYRNSSILSLVSDVFIVLLCSLAILGLLFRQMNISVPVDPLEWQISQDTANGIVACLANTIGAAESVLRVAATGHDKRLFLKLWDDWPQVLQWHMLGRKRMYKGTTQWVLNVVFPTCDVLFTQSSLNRVIKLVGAFWKFTNVTCSAWTLWLVTPACFFRVYPLHFNLFYIHLSRKAK